MTTEEVRLKLRKDFKDEIKTLTLIYTMEVNMMMMKIQRIGKREDYQKIVDDTIQIQVDSIMKSVDSLVPRICQIGMDDLLEEMGIPKEKMYEAMDRIVAKDMGNFSKEFLEMLSALGNPNSGSKPS